MPSSARLAVDSARMPLGDVGELACKVRSGLDIRGPDHAVHANRHMASARIVHPRPDLIKESGEAGEAFKRIWSTKDRGHKFARHLTGLIPDRAIAFGFPSGGPECRRAHRCSISGLGRRHRQPPVISTNRDARGHRDGGFELHAECNGCSGEVLQFGLAFHPPRASRTEL